MELFVIDASTRGVIVGGVALAILGLIGLAIPVFTTHETKDVARIGDLRLETTDSASHSIPAFLSLGALGLGIVLIGTGVYRKA
jgi:hypothetical protein